MTDKQTRRTFELNKQVSQTKEKNMKQKQKFLEINERFKEDAENFY